ncbi:MAG TPA: hypothetical protein VK308_10820 [Pyrinomonadaceae bacterium]|nr:hypothetical protein [Pyrinomonadaceae bacterium]
MNKKSDMLYTINGNDEIVSVSKYWAEFADCNDAPELSTGKVLNRRLWEFITDDTTQEVYRKIVDKVRGGKTVAFNFNCDAPAYRRVLEMTVSLLEDGNVQFETREILAEERIRQNVFQNGIERSASIITVCSWCKKFDAQDGNWLEVEEAVLKLNLFEMEKLPQLSHGMCLSCYQLISGDYQDASAENASVINLTGVNLN